MIFTNKWYGHEKTMHFVWFGLDGGNRTNIQYDHCVWQPAIRSLEVIKCDSSKIFWQSEYVRAFYVTMLTISASTALIMWLQLVDGGFFLFHIIGDDEPICTVMDETDRIELMYWWRQWPMRALGIDILLCLCCCRRVSKHPFFWFLIGFQF